MTEQFTRKVTDVVFLVIFLLSFVGVIILFVYPGAIRGYSTRWITGFDSYGNQCGQSNGDWREYVLANSVNDTSNSPNDTRVRTQSTDWYVGTDNTNRSIVFYFDILKSFTAYKESTEICVSKCPDSPIETVEAYKEWVKETGASLCLPKPGLTVDSLTDDDFTSDGPCPKLPIPPMAQVGRWCFPKSMFFLMNSTKTLALTLSERSGDEQPTAEAALFAQGTWSRLGGWFASCFRDVYVAMPQLAASLGLAIIMSFLVIMIMQFIAKVATVLITIFGVLGTGVLAGYFWYTYVGLKNEEERFRTKRLPVLQWTYDALYANMVFAIIATIAFIILAILAIVMLSKLGLVAKLMSESARFVRKVPSIFFLPLVCFITLVIWFAVWFACIGIIMSSNDFGIEATSGLVTFELGSTDTALVWVAILLAGWHACFLFDLEDMALGVAISDWFHSTTRSETCTPRFWCGSCMGYFDALRYHSGSVALGSLMVWSLKVIRAIIAYFHTKVKQAQATSTTGGCCLACLECIAKACFCCFWAFECCIQMITTKAYYVVAATNRSFCSAAKHSGAIMIEQATEVIALQTASTLTFFIAKMLVAAVNTLIGQAILSSMIPEDVLTYRWIPALLTFVISYLVAHMAIDLFDSTIDALFLIAGGDKDRLDGNTEQAMPLTAVATAKSSGDFDDDDNDDPLQRTSVMVRRMNRIMSEVSV